MRRETVACIGVSMLTMSPWRADLYARSRLAEIAFGLQYINNEELAEFRELLDHVGRMPTRLLKRPGS